MAARIGIDTGGTFTDVVRVQRGAVRVHKLRSTPQDPSRAVLDGLAGDLREQLEELLRVDEVDAVASRCERLLRRGVLPSPRGGWPSIPWPPF